MYQLPSKPEKIDFSWIFSRISQEEVYLFYLGFCELNKKFINPLRTDKKPDCKFFWYNNTLFFRDFAINKTYSCVTIVMEIRNLNYYEALDDIYEQFIGRKGNSFVINKQIITHIKQEKDIKCKIQPFTKIDIEYLKQYGITSKLCKMYNVYSIQNYWLNGEMYYTYSNNNPCIGYYFPDEKKWKLYFYKNKEFRFLCNIGHDNLQGYNQLDWVGDICIITKSMKDVMCWRRFGYNAVAPHSEGLSSWKDKIKILQSRFDRVILNFDNDNAGIKAAKEVLKEFNLEEFYFEIKDLSDTFKELKEEKTLEIINEMINGRICIS
jgi:hypothetical protein